MYDLREGSLPLDSRPRVAKHTGERLTAKHFFNLATALFGILAAGLWFLSAKVNSGNKFEGIKGAIGMKEEAEKLNALGAAYNRQSTFNALAASAAGISALCQTAAVYLDW